MAQSFRTNLSNVAANYLQRLQVRVTKTTLQQSLEQNPYYPSLYSLSNVFGRFNIDNQAFEIENEKLSQFKLPFITYLSIPAYGKDFVLVTKFSNTEVSYLSEGNKTKTISKDEFLKRFQKIVFVAEGNAQSGEKEYEKKLNKEKKVQNKNAALTGIGILLLLLILFQFFNSLTLGEVAAAMLAITKLAGLTATLLLLAYEIDNTNSFVKNICSLGRQTNCDAVLNSKAGKILGISWSENGFFYFAATGLFLLLPGIAFTNKLPWLAISSTLVAPYILFSVYYQWKVVKQWCPLCLAAQAVLAMELAWAIIDFWLAKKPLFQAKPFPGTWGELRAAAFCILLPMVLWFIFKPLVLKAKVAKAYNNAYKRLLYNPDTFNSLLQQQTLAPDGWQHLGINIGNPGAANTIIKVCNPYCGPCAKAHPLLEEIVKQNKEVRLKVIFTATNNENDKTNKPVKHLLAIAAKKDFKLTEQALDDWYLSEKKDYDAFAARYPMNGELKEQEVNIDLMKSWCDEAEITGTPTIFINGRCLPETYNINELKNIF